MRLTARGRACHSGYPELGESAIEKLIMSARWILVVFYGGLGLALGRSGDKLEVDGTTLRVHRQTDEGHVAYESPLPALVAVQHEPHLAGFYHRLVARGKAKLQALTAVMRKLIILLNRLLKNPNFQLAS